MVHIDFSRNKACSRQKDSASRSKELEYIPYKESSHKAG